MIVAINYKLLLFRTFHPINPAAEILSYFVCLWGFHFIGVGLWLLFHPYIPTTQIANNHLPQKSQVKNQLGITILTGIVTIKDYSGSKFLKLN